jgi:hypothetical protein
VYPIGFSYGTRSGSRWCCHAGMRHLAALPSLTCVTVSYTAVTDDGMRSLSTLTALRHLNLDSCQVRRRARGGFR